MKYFFFSFLVLFATIVTTSQASEESCFAPEPNKPSSAPSRLASSFLKEAARIRWTMANISPSDFLIKLILEVLQSRQSLIPSTIGINQGVSVMGLNIQINSLTFNKPRVTDVTINSMTELSTGVFDISARGSGSFPGATLHVTVGSQPPIEVDLGDLTLVAEANDTGLTIPCSNPSSDITIGKVVVTQLHLTSSSTDSLVVLLTGAINSNPEIISSLITQLTAALVPTSVAVPDSIKQYLSLICLVPNAAAAAAPRLNFRATVADTPISFLTEVINDLISSNPDIDLGNCKSNLNSLRLCNIVSTSKSWGGLNDACRAACQVPCQTAYGACMISRAACWIPGVPCPDCDGERDSCLKACQNSCKYSLSVSAGLSEVDGVAGTRVISLTLDSTARTIAVAFVIPELQVHAFEDVTGISASQSFETSSITVDAALSYSCSSSGQLQIALNSLKGTPIDLDSVFSFLHSSLGSIPFGLGDAVNSWLTSQQVSITADLMTALKNGLGDAIGSQHLSVPGGINLCT